MLAGSRTSAQHLLVRCVHEQLRESIAGVLASASELSPRLSDGLRVCHATHGMRLHLHKQLFIALLRIGLSKQLCADAVEAAVGKSAAGDASEAATARQEAHTQLSEYAEQLRVRNEELQHQLAAAAEQVQLLRHPALPANLQQFAFFPVSLLVAPLLAASLTQLTLYMRQHHFPHDQLVYISSCHSGVMQACDVRFD